MIKALFKNSPTSDLDEIREAVDTLIHEMLEGDEKPQVPVIQINQAAYSDLRCYIDEFALDALVQEGYMVVGEVMPQEELEELFDSIEIPDRLVVFDETLQRIEVPSGCAIAVGGSCISLCPKCGAEAVVSIATVRAVRSVQCMRCHYKGPEMPSSVEAVEAWNKLSEESNDRFIEVEEFGGIWPCPGCGMTPTVSQDGDFGWNIQCSSYGSHGDTKKEAIKNWNEMVRLLKISEQNNGEKA